MSNLKPKQLILTVLIISLLGGFLRFWSIGERSYWGHEIITRDWAQDLNNWEGLRQLIVSSNPPLYFLVLKVWQTMEDSEAHLRMLSALCGTIAIPLVFMLGISCLDNKTAIMGSLLMALSPLQIFWAQVVRPYQFLSIWMLISLIFYLQAIQKGRMWGWLGYAIGSSLSIYTHYAGFSVVLIAGCYFLLNWRRFRKHRPFFLLSHLVILLFFTPWIVLSMGILKSGGAQAFSAALQTTYTGRLMKFAYIPFVFSLGSSVAPWALGVVIPAIVVFGGLMIRSISSKANDSSGKKFLLIMLLIPPIIWIPLVPHVKESHLLVISTAYYLLLGKGILSFRSPIFRGASLVAICLFFTISLYHYEKKDSLHIHYTGTIVPWREVSEMIKKDEMERDLILFNHPEHLDVFKYYYKGNLTPFPLVQSDLDGKLSREVEKYERAWLILRDNKNQKEQLNLMGWMDSRYCLISEKKYLKNHRVVAGLRDRNMKAYLYYALKIYLYDLKKQKSTPVEEEFSISSFF